MRSYHPLRQVRFDLGRPVVHSSTAEDAQQRITELLARGDAPLPAPHAMAPVRDISSRAKADGVAPQRAPSSPEHPAQPKASA